MVNGRDIINVIVCRLVKLFECIKIIVIIDIILFYIIVC